MMSKRKSLQRQHRVIKMDYALIAQIATPIISIAGIVATAKWIISKEKLRAFRQLIDSVDDAVTDDKISESEFQAIWNSFRKVIS